MRDGDSGLAAFGEAILRPSAPNDTRFARLGVGRFVDVVARCEIERTERAINGSARSHAPRSYVARGRCAVDQALPVKSTAHHTAVMTVVGVVPLWWRPEIPGVQRQYPLKLRRFYRKRVSQHLRIGIETMRLLRSGGGSLHSASWRLQRTRLPVAVGARPVFPGIRPTDGYAGSMPAIMQTGHNFHS